MPVSSLSRSRLLQLAPPANNWRWLAVMPSDFGDARNIVVEEMTFPHVKIPAQGRFSGGSNTYYPTTHDVNSVNITFYEDEDFTALTYLTNWSRAVVNPDTGTYGYPIDYKREIKFEKFALDGRLVMTGTLFGCWPSELSDYNLNYNESGRMVTSCVFSVDSVTTSLVKTRR